MGITNIFVIITASELVKSHSVTDSVPSTVWDIAQRLTFADILKHT